MGELVARQALLLMKEIYLVHVDKYIGAYRAGRCPNISYAPADKFIDFVQSLREEYPEYKLRCVLNEGIEAEVKKFINSTVLAQFGKNSDVSR